MYYIHPATSELYYMCMLLMIAEGATNYADILTFNGRVYNTNREACEGRGLLESDNEWNLLFDEAIVSHPHTSLGNYLLLSCFIVLSVMCVVCLISTGFTLC
jgi:hypothetical protein